MNVRGCFAMLGLTFVLLSDAGWAQSASLSVTNLSFPGQLIGATAAPKSFTLSNPDAATPLEITSILDSGDYAETDNCGSSLAPLASCTISVTFTPTMPGRISGSITIENDASNSPQVVSLNGNGLTPVSFGPASLSFGTVAVGTKSAAKTLTIANNQSTVVSLQFSTSGDYSAAGSGTTPCGTSLAAKSRCTLAVRFQPTVNGTIKGALSLTYNAPFSPLSVPLTGAGSGGSGAPLTFSPTSLSFGNVVLNTTSQGKAVTVKNVSAAAVTISSLGASGNYSAAGSGATPCGGPLNPGSSCTLTATFTPTITGTIAGAITVNDNASDTPQVLGLTGKGIQLVTLTPATLSFPAQRLETVSATQTVMLTNHQSADTLQIDDISVSGNFRIVPTGAQPCDSRLAALSSCTIGVVFAPAAGGGSVHGALTVAYNASSTPGIVNLSASATGSLPRFAYSANGDNTISSYTVDAITGQLRSTGYVLIGTRPNAVVTTSPGAFVYTANFNAGNVSGYQTDSAGRLTQVPGSPFAGEPDAFAITVDPSGRFLYVANANSTSNNISGYTINSSTGVLTPISGSPFQAGNDTRAIAIDATGKFLYSANATSNDVSAYTINATTGVLTQVTGSPFALPSGAQVPQSIAIDSSSKFVFVGDTASPDVCAFTINSATGALTVVTGSPFPNAGAGEAVSLTVDASGRFLYAANATASVTGYSIDAGSGALTPLSGSPYSAGTSTTSVMADPSGRFLYVTDDGGDVLVFAIDSGDGQLRASHTIMGRSSPRWLALATGTSPVTYTPKFVYAANSDDNNISTYATDAENGSLTPVTGSPFALDGPAGSDPQAFSVAIDPIEKFEYVVEYNGNGPNGYIAAYNVNFLTGALTFTSASPFAIGDQPRWVSVDPSGRFLYATNAFSDNISGFSIDRNSGNLAALSASPYSTGPATNPWAVAIDPSGQFLLVSKQAANQVECFAIDSVSGNLNPVSSAVTGTPPQGLAVDPSGRFVYVSAVDGIHGYTLSPSGSLAGIAGSPFMAGGDPVALAVDPTGRFVYSANQGSSDVSAFVIDQSSGALIPVVGSPFVAGQNPHMLTADDSGDFLYVANAGSNDVSVFAINAVTGALSLNPSGPFTAGSVTYAIASLASAH